MSEWIGPIVVVAIVLDTDEPLAALIDDRLRFCEEDVLAAPAQPSEELRASMLLPSFDDLPLTENGKLDRARLPEPGQARASAVR